MTLFTGFPRLVLNYLSLAMYTGALLHIYKMGSLVHGKTKAPLRLSLVILFSWRCSLGETTHLVKSL